MLNMSILFFIAVWKLLLLILVGMILVGMDALLNNTLEINMFQPIFCKKSSFTSCRVFDEMFNGIHLVGTVAA